MQTIITHVVAVALGAGLCAALMLYAQRGRPGTPAKRLSRARHLLHAIGYETSLREAKKKGCKALAVLDEPIS